MPHQPGQLTIAAGQAGLFIHLFFTAGAAYPAPILLRTNNIMQEFTKLERIDPAIKPSSQRVKNFDEISEVYTKEEAGTQASRCIQCGNPYCSASGCPLGNSIPQWLKFIAEKDLRLAFDISNETSPFPEILGRICPQDRLCEGACTLNDGHGAITIGSIEVAISERGFDKGMKPVFADRMTGKTVGIIGSGPAGLSCATFLLRAGIKPVVYEKADEAGGLLIYGIPNFKLNKQSVQRRIQLLTEAGMELQLGVEIGKDLSFDQLCQRHDAVFIATGATEGKVLGTDVYQSAKLYMAVPFLTSVQQKLLEKPYDRKYDVKGKHVVVIGGGDTAMDCVRTSIREGAAKVQCVYRRDEANMPGSRKEVKSAKEEGVEFVFCKTPKSFITNDHGQVMAVNFVDTELIKDPASGRDRMQEVPNTDMAMYADVFILALGFGMEKLEYLKQAGIELTEWGGIRVDEKYQTTRERVYAGGDNVRGADLVVTAALDGREAAMSIVEEILVKNAVKAG